MEPFTVIANEHLPANMVASSPERLKVALVALQNQARYASQYILAMRSHDGNVSFSGEAVDELRKSQEVIKTMQRECFIIIEGAKLARKPVPELCLHDLAFTGLIALNLR